jgi:hypothetical protein
MSLINPIVETTKLSRWPFQRRPVAPTGTKLVFKRNTGDLLYRETSMLASDVSLRGLQEMYTVDVRTHGSSFRCQLPSRNIALQFDVTVGYSWRVADPLTLVTEGVHDAPSECQSYLTQLMRPICRGVEEHAEHEAERALNAAFTFDIQLDRRGLTIMGVTVEVRSDRDVLDLGREEHAQAGSLRLHKLRLDFFDQIVRNGTIVANILAQDPSKADEAANFLDKQLADNRHTAISTTPSAPWSNGSATS